MKKTSAKKATKNNKRAAVRPVATVSTIKPAKTPTCSKSWSFSIYIYWFIILFFIAATFYILGRHHTVTNVAGAGDVAVVATDISEEKLLQAHDYYESGKTKLTSGQIDDAIADLTLAIDGGAASVDTYILRGEAYMQSGDYRRAMDDLNLALMKNPANPVVYYDRYLLNSRLEDYESAMNDINNALAANASNPSSVLQMRDLYAKRGQLNLWLKNWEGAIADFTNSLARPEGKVDPSVYADRAEAYIALGKYSDAVNDYSAAVRVISEQIQGAPTMDEREYLSSRAMGYFEKSAALNLNLKNIDAARTDLESAYTIAVALNDSDSIQRLQGLIADLNETASNVAQ